MLLPNGLADTVTFDWNIGWVNANPDGLAERPVIAINGQWPLPILNITKGDRVIVNMHNQVRLIMQALLRLTLTFVSSEMRARVFTSTVCSRMAPTRWTALSASRSVMSCQARPSPTTSQ